MATFHWLPTLEKETDRSFSDIQPVSGGDISEAFRLSSKAGDFFLKVNHRSDAERMFRVETESLRLLSQSGKIRTPEVIWVGKLGKGAGLLLEFIASKRPTAAELFQFGQDLARMHQQTGTGFGWDRDNYIGSLPQSNTPHPTWPEFYGYERLIPQLEISRQRGMLAAWEIPQVEELLPRLEELLPHTAPGLLHGDLWSGNYLISSEGQACLIDPAVYYGHGEVDLAMSRLFGGFGSAFYRGYHEVLPPQAGHEDRQDIYQLYYLLVHLNLFGRGYYGSVSRVLRRYF